MKAARRIGTRLALIASLAIAGAFAFAPAALAADGEGLAGRTTDKGITFFCFGVIALFMLLPIVLSFIQARLEGRKDRMREQLERVSRP